MTEIFEEDDFFKFNCEWIYLDEKKLTASTRPGAALIIFGIHMHSKMFKILIKMNNPRAKERQLTEFSWDSLRKVTISKRDPIHETIMVLNKKKCGYTACSVAAKPEIFSKMYDVLNVVFFHLMNIRFKTNCTQVCNNIRALNSFEAPREIRNADGTVILRAETTVGDLINGMLTTFEKQHNIPQSTGRNPCFTSKDTLTIELESPEDNVDSSSEDNADPVPETNVDSVLEAYVNTAREADVDSAAEATLDSPPEGNVDSPPDSNMDSTSEDDINLKPKPVLAFDLYQILNVPSFVAIICTLLINLYYYLFNHEM